jgi:hypothetical protein
MPRDHQMITAVPAAILKRSFYDVDTSQFNRMAQGSNIEHLQTVVHSDFTISRANCLNTFCTTPVSITFNLNLYSNHLGAPNGQLLFRGELV